MIASTNRDNHMFLLSDYDHDGNACNQVVSATQVVLIERAHILLDNEYNYAATQYGSIHRVEKTLDNGNVVMGFHTAESFDEDDLFFPKTIKQVEVL